MSSSLISHPGVVTGWDNDRLKIRIVTGSACGGCSAKHACPSKGSSESRDSEIFALPTPGEEYHPFDAVTVIMSTAQGYKAVLWAFLIPLALFLITIFALGTWTGSEVAAALGGLLVLGMSWGSLGLFQKRFKKEFVFQARRSS